MSPRRPVARLLGVVVTAVALMMAMAAMPASAASTGRVKGVVTVGGKPLDFAKVQLYRDIDGDPGGDGDDRLVKRIKTVNTGKNGRYSFSGLKSKKDRKTGLETYHYFVLATDRSGQSVRRVLTVKVKKGKTVKKNFSLKPAAIVKGQVARSDGRSPVGLVVTAYTDETIPDRGYSPELLPNTTTTVRANGTFVLGGLQPRGYEELTVAGDRYAAQAYDFVAGELTSDPKPPARVDFSVSGGQVLSIGSVTVSDLISKVSGKVAGSSGDPLKNIVVRLAAPAGGGSTDRETTSSTGRFTFTHLRSGTHVVKFEDPRGVWASQYADGAVHRADARVLNVVAGNNITDVDVTLKSNARVKATLVGGKSKASAAFSITRKATGGKPGGVLTVTLGSVSKTVKVVKGKATAKFSNLPRGTRQVTATYSGTGSTQGFTKTYTVKVK